MVDVSRSCLFVSTLPDVCRVLLQAEEVLDFSFFPFFAATSARDRNNSRCYWHNTLECFNDDGGGKVGVLYCDATHCAFNIIIHAFCPVSVVVLCMYVCSLSFSFLFCFRYKM